jgi:hypothetical protein
MKFLWSSSFVLALAAFSGDESIVVNASVEEPIIYDEHLEQAREIFNWIAGSTGGYVTPKQGVRRAVPGDVTTPLGVYATKRIEAGELVTKIPWENIIKSDDPDEEGQMCCGTVRSVAREMKLGNASKYAPYAIYLKSEPPNQIPSSWSKASQDLLLEVVRHNLIPPEDPLKWITEEWLGRCKGDPNDKVGIEAALLVVQRADDSIMVPAYDVSANGYCMIRNPPQMIVRFQNILIQFCSLFLLFFVFISFKGV